MIAAEQAKKTALALGADMVGIAPPSSDSKVRLFKWTPGGSCRRQVRDRDGLPGDAGALRGIEEGTFFSNYSSTGYGGLTCLYIPWWW